MSREPGEKCACAVCGHQWEQGQHGGHNCAQVLKAQLELVEQALANTARIFQEIPECSVHGENCVPHAIDWIRGAKRGEEEARLVIELAAHPDCPTGLGLGGMLAWHREQIKELRKRPQA